MVDRSSTTAASNETPEQGIRRCTDLLVLCPGNADILRERAELWRQVGQYQNALDDYDEAIANNPDDGYAYAGRAWIWATCPDEAFRNGARAVKGALKAYRLGDRMALAWDSEKGEVYSDFTIFATLAAAYAEAAKFDKAQEMIQRGIFFTRDEKAKKELQDHDQLYRCKQPYREPPVSPEMAEMGARAAEWFG